MSAIATTAVDYALKGLIGDERVTGAPATLYVGLSNTLPTMTTGVISGTTEPTTGSYARVSVANTDANWDVSARVASNIADVTFPDATADWDVTVSYWFVSTASTAGTILSFGAFAGAVTKTVYNGVILTLDAGTIGITVPA